MITKESPLPKYYRLKQIMKGEIKKGTFPLDSRFPSEREWMSQHEVSRATVRQAMEELEREGILLREQGKGTFVKEPPTKLKRFKILIPKIALHKHSFFFDVIKGCEAATNGQAELSIQTHEMNNEALSSAIRGSESDGFLIMAPPNTEDLSILKGIKTPLILIGGYSPNPDFHAVYSDSYQGSFRLTEYLIKKGHKKIALLGGAHSKTFLAIDFLKGYRDALTAHGISFEAQWRRECSWTKKEGCKLTKELLKLKELPTAIFAGDDTIAVGVIKTLKERGIRIPQEMAVVGFNDLDLATVVEPHLTTMRVPQFEMGEAAYAILCKLVRKEKLTQKHTIFKTELIIRESS